MKRVYLIRYVDERTGFIEREELDTHRAAMTRIAELNARGAKDVKLMPIVRGKSLYP